MLAIAGQTNRPNGLTFFLRETMGVHYPLVKKILTIFFQKQIGFSKIGNFFFKIKNAFFPRATPDAYQ